MSQPSVSAYYSLRKRGSDISTAKTIKSVQDEVTSSEALVSSTRKPTRGGKMEAMKPKEEAKVVVVKRKTVAKNAESLTIKSKISSLKVCKLKIFLP